MFNTNHTLKTKGFTTCNTVIDWINNATHLVEAETTILVSAVLKGEPACCTDAEVSRAKDLIGNRRHLRKDKAKVTDPGLGTGWNDQAIGLHKNIAWGGNE
jgi:hypothetical protein